MTKNLAWPIEMAMNDVGKMLLANQHLFDQISESARAKGVAGSEIDVTARLLVAQGRWVDAGSVVYELTPELTAAFADTAFPLTGRDIDVPHSAFYISSPESGLLVSDGKNMVPLNGWYVTTHSDHFDFIAVAIGGDGAFCHFRVPCDVEIESWLDSRSDRDRAIVGGANVEYFLTWVRVVIGTCAYLACAEPDVLREQYDQRREHRDAAGDRKKRLKEVAISVSYFRVGTREKFSEFFGADAETRRLTRRFVVRGHYRRLSSGRTTWVRPHWKGPAWGDIAKAHVVKLTEAT